MAAALLIGAGAACSGDDGGSTTPTDEASGDVSTTATSAAPPTAPPATSSPSLVCPDPFAGNSPANFVASAGQYVAMLVAMSAADRTLSFDVVQWLVGPDADAAYQAETGATEEVPNDYFIVNDSPQVRTAAVAPTADVRVLDGAGSSAADTVATSFDELAATSVEGSPFWLTVDGGVVVGICQQYVP